MCEICEIKAKEIQRLHRVCQMKNVDIELAIERLENLPALKVEECIEEIVAGLKRTLEQ